MVIGVLFLFRISEFLQETATFTGDMDKTEQLLTDISTTSEIFHHIQDVLNSFELEKLTGMSY